LGSPFVSSVSGRPLYDHLVQTQFSRRLSRRSFLRSPPSLPPPPLPPCRGSRPFWPPLLESRFGGNVSGEELFFTRPLPSFLISLPHPSVPFSQCCSSLVQFGVFSDLPPPHAQSEPFWMVLSPISEPDLFLSGCGKLMLEPSPLPLGT